LVPGTAYAVGDEPLRGRASEQAARALVDRKGAKSVPPVGHAPVLKRILAVLDEELLIGIERRLPDEEPEREVVPVPELAGA
jgi:hypothetical protein